jgi:hypothetical protein
MRDVKKHWFPKVIVRYGRPLQFTQIDEPTKEQSQAVSEEIFRHVLDMWWELDAEFEPKWRRDERAKTGELPRRS